MLLTRRVSTSSSFANPADGFDTLIVHPTAKMHLSVNIIRLSNVHTGRILKLDRGKPRPTRIVTLDHATKLQTTTGITSDKCKLEGKADRGERRFCLIRASKGFDGALSTYARTRDAEIALGRSERYSASDLQHRAFGEPCTEFGRGKIENPKGVPRGVAAARMDGTLLTQRPLRFELADDRLTHDYPSR
jgi:hypothetical protein